MGILSRMSASASILPLSVKKFFLDLLDVTTVAATGSTQAGAAALNSNRVVVTDSDGTKGVRLPLALAGMAVDVVNTVSNQLLKVYPGVGDNINAAADDVAFTQSGGSRATYFADINNHWYVAQLDTLEDATFATEAGAGITGGTGTVYESSVQRSGGIITSSILIDLTGLSSSTTDLDIIGTGASAAHIGQITAARNGTLLTGRMTCLEAPVGGIADIDVYSATEATGVFDQAISALVEVIALTAGSAWAIGDSRVFTGIPAANKYLYLTGGAAGTADVYTAGKFKIELEGYDA